MDVLSKPNGPISPKSVNNDQNNPPNEKEGESDSILVCPASLIFLSFILPINKKEQNKIIHQSETTFESRKQMIY
jgi:hypothetical protein